MLTIITSITGFIGGFLPTLLKIYQGKQDQKHELAILKLQMEAQAQGHQERLAEIEANADIQSEINLPNAVKYQETGSKVIDGILGFLNGTVRPVITYAFAGLYGVHKYTVIQIARETGETALEAIKGSYSEFDQSAFMLVLSYYFGQRAAVKIFGLHK